MFEGKYKKILERMPDGVFVFDDKLRVAFTNAAFRRSFSDKAKAKGSLKDVLGCGESGKCGESSACEYCTFYRAATQAIRKNTEQTETLDTTISRSGRMDKVSVRIRVLPVEGKKKLYLGLTDGKYQTEMAQEMLSAKRMQQRLLPAGKSAGGVPYSYMYIPCLEVGGDMPEVYERDGQTYGVIADVAGKGVSAAMLSSFVKAAYDTKEERLDVAFEKLNEKFNELDLDERSYITAAAVRIDEREGVLRYSFAGHNAPILLKTAEGVNEIEMSAQPISNWGFDTGYKEMEMPFDKGDVLVLLTDGVTECMNSAGELFGIERTVSVLHQSYDANDFIGKLRSALNVFSGAKFTDDITVIAFDL